MNSFQATANTVAAASQRTVARRSKVDVREYAKAIGLQIKCPVLPYSQRQSKKKVISYGLVENPA